MATRVKQEERSQEYKDKMEAEVVLFILATGGKRRKDRAARALSLIKQSRQTRRGKQRVLDYNVG